MSVKSGVAAIADEVLGDVQKEAEAILSAAESQAKETLRKAKEQADRSFHATVAEAKEKAEAEKRKRASVAEVEVRNRLLKTKEDLVDEAFEKALVELRGFVETDKYQAYLLDLIEKIAKKMDQKVLVVEVNAKDKALLTQEKLKKTSNKLGVELKISKATPNYLGGCKVQSEDGKIVYDGTLDNRLAELKPQLRAKIAKTLFGEETKDGV
ncbi:MAG: V-type ATP synthase subunit E [Candidatus Bathyarchaeota archaeon]|nr:V-type ATP synthase subunit E [Candidatus Bathyarchaeota archaeon]